MSQLLVRIFVETGERVGGIRGCATASPISGAEERVSLRIRTWVALRVKKEREKASCAIAVRHLIAVSLWLVRSTYQRKAARSAQLLVTAENMMLVPRRRLHAR